MTWFGPKGPVYVCPRVPLGAGGGSCILVSYKRPTSEVQSFLRLVQTRGNRRPRSGLSESLSPEPHPNLRPSRTLLSEGKVCRRGKSPRALPPHRHSSTSPLPQRHPLHYPPTDIGSSRHRRTQAHTHTRARYLRGLCLGWTVPLFTSLLFTLPPPPPHLPVCLSLRPLALTAPFCRSDCGTTEQTDRA